MLLILEPGRQSKSSGMVIFWYSDTKQIFLFLFLENYLSPSSPSSLLENIWKTSSSKSESIFKTFCRGVFLPCCSPLCGVHTGLLEQKPSMFSGGQSVELGRGVVRPPFRKPVFPRPGSECGHSGAKALGRVHIPRHKYSKLCTS